MNRNYYIADTHFGHANVIRFDRRPFYDVEEMENVFVHNWNATVWPADTVYILGNFVWGKQDEWLRIVKRLKGNKVLIQGNHALKQYPPELRQHFADVKDYKEVEDKNRKVICCTTPSSSTSTQTGKVILCSVATCTTRRRMTSWRSGLRRSKTRLQLTTSTTWPTLDRSTT